MNSTKPSACLSVTAHHVAVSVLSLMFVGGLAACSGDKDSSTGGAASGPAESAEVNTWAVRKASIDAYFTAVEGAADYDNAFAAGQAWLDKNLPAYKKNCEQFVIDRQDLLKANQIKGNRTDTDAYVARLHKVAGHDPKNVDNLDMKALKRSGLLQKQMYSFWSCDVAIGKP